MLGESAPAATESAAARLRDVLHAAEATGLLAGPRAVTLRGRMPAALVEQARQRTGATSDTELIEIALATVAMTDNYAEWLISQRGAIDPDLDIEF